jgi:uncharacterized protein (DUF4415 family)
MRAKSTAMRRTSRRRNQELPELTEEMLARAVLKRAGKRVGRPPLPNPKVAISLRLAPQVLKRWKASGSGWQTRMAEVLAKRAP